MENEGEEAAAPTATRFRIRWGWFFGCVVLGLGAITVGWIIAATLGYLAGVLANVGTTLLLVGIVVLLERRIIDNAVRAVRNANERSQDALRMQIRDLEDQVASIWDSATADDVARKKAETARLTNEFTQRVVDDSAGER